MGWFQMLVCEKGHVKTSRVPGMTGGAVDELDAVDDEFEGVGGLELPQAKRNRIGSSKKRRRVPGEPASRSAAEVAANARLDSGFLIAAPCRKYTPGGAPRGSPAGADVAITSRSAVAQIPA
jgi:hypothetical protein